MQKRYAEALILGSFARNREINAPIAGVLCLINCPRNPGQLSLTS